MIYNSARGFIAPVNISIAARDRVVECQWNLCHVCIWRWEAEKQALIVRWGCCQMSLWTKKEEKSLKGRAGSFLGDVRLSPYCSVHDCPVNILRLHTVGFTPGRVASPILIMFVWLFAVLWRGSSACSKLSTYTFNLHFSPRVPVLLISQRKAAPWSSKRLHSYKLKSLA